MMKIIRTQGDEPCHLSPLQPVFLAIGVFDGVHLGHQRVIRHTIECARLAKGIAAVYTFSPHPSSVVGIAKPLIFSLETKYERMASLGVDVMIEQRFDALFAQLSGEKFIQLLQEKIPTLRGICVGEDFKFGTFRSEDTHSLDALAQKAHMETHILPDLYFKNDFRISSTKIRQAIGDGNMELANDLLGMPYEIHGTIGSDARVGKYSYYPLHLHSELELKPPSGLYYVYYRRRNVSMGNGLWYCLDDDVMPSWGYPLEAIEFFPNDEIQINCLHFVDKPKRSFLQEERKIISESDKEAAKEYFLQRFPHVH